jgi:putative endonuclease
MYFVYILRSLKDNKKYIGLTNDLQKRLAEHNNGKCSATKNRRPFELLHYETFSVREEAAKREKFFKTGKGREFIKLTLKL